MILCSVSVKRYGSGNVVSGIRARGFLRRKGCRTIGIGRLAGREVHSRSVIKEGARAAEEMMRWNLSIESHPVVGLEEFDQQDNDP